MQRYFLIFSIIFLSYLLLINYNPPVDSFKEEISVSDSEYSLSSDTDDFVSGNDIVSEETFLIAETCSDNDSYSFSNENWKAKIDLKTGKIIYAELIKFPENSGSEINKLIFNDCGLERYSQLSGFAFLNFDLFVLSLIHI